METVTVNLGKKTYTIEIAFNLLSSVGPKIRALSKGEIAVIVTDSNVGPLYAKTVEASLKAAGFKVEIITFAAGEQSKNLHTLSTIYAALAKAGVTRSDVLVALGGGVTGDMAGLAAATFLRGIDFVQIPTTVLAMVDSSVGGKVAVDLPEGKNLVGAFYQPKAVYIDIEVLQTLDPRFFYDGMSEVIKYGCINDPALFELLEKTGPKQVPQYLAVIIAACCNIKARIVERDEFDTGERMVLNFGHTLGHAIEKAYNYNKYSHGEAVAVGMATITAASEKAGFTKAGTTERIKELLTLYHLPLEAGITEEQMADAVRLDKKKKGHELTIVLLKEIGTSFLKKIDFKDVNKYI
jgi:3-dehydroquinate synthase